jgi:hypothetical protein
MAKIISLWTALAEQNNLSHKAKAEIILACL